MSIGSRLSSGGHPERVVPPPSTLGGVAFQRARRQNTASSGSFNGKAAEYVRMSTEHQRYSTENQADAIRQYAERRGLEVVRTYADEGKSGLRIDGRDALNGRLWSVEGWPETASQSRASLERLPVGRHGVTLLDPYYFDHSMVYSDDSYCEGNIQLFTHAYRLRPCGVFALNFDPRRDRRHTGRVRDLRRLSSWHRPLGKAALVQRDVAGGPSTGVHLRIRDAALGHSQTGRVEVEGRNPVLELLKLQCEMAVETGGAAKAEVEPVIRRFGGAENLPTPVERGFRNLSDTVWFGEEPFPSLNDFEYQLIGADLKQRKVSVPLWFRPSRAPFVWSGT